MHVFHHLLGRSGEMVTVEIRFQAPQIAATEVEGERDQSVELVLGELLVEF